MDNEELLNLFSFDLAEIKASDSKNSKDIIKSAQLNWQPLLPSQWSHTTSTFNWVQAHFRPFKIT